MPSPDCSRVTKLAERSPRMVEPAWMAMVLRTATYPRTSAMALPSQAAVRQASSCMPRQVPHTGKTLPFLFSAMAYLRTYSAFWVHLVVMLISVSPPGKRTPLMRGRSWSKQERLLQAKMGTTCAPDIWMYLMQEAAMQETFWSLLVISPLTPSMVGSSLSVDCVKIPIMGRWLGSSAAAKARSSSTAIAFM